MNSSNERPVHKQKAIWRILALACLVGLVPYLLAWRSRVRLSQMKMCQENLTKIDGGKEQWALENNKSPGTPFTIEELLALPVPHNAYPSSRLRECPSGRGVYVANPVGTDPICTSGLPGHSLAEAEEWSRAHE